MQIKVADGKQSDLDALTALLLRTDVDARTRDRIAQEIRTIGAGDKGERDAAYEIEFHMRDNRNWATIHDLRLEVGERVAQIDHLLIDRLLTIWVCESKHFAEGVAINEHGEWHRYWNGRKHGIASPVEQNRKHITVLRDVFDQGRVTLPRRLGITIKPSFKSLILVSNGARITRPPRSARVEGIESVIKCDQLRSTIDKRADEGNPLELAKLVGRDTLEDVARQLAVLHRPLRTDWAAWFGLAAEPSASSAPRPADPPASSAPPSAPGQPTRQRLVCAACGTTVSYSVAKFCWFNKARFGGHVLCMDCQRTA